MKAGTGRSLLVVKPSSLGDIVHAIPAVVSLHRSLPGAAIHWIVNTEWEPLLGGMPFVQPVPFPRKAFTGAGGCYAARRWARENLRSLEPDLAIDFQGLIRSAWLTRMSRAGSVAGFRQAREGAWLFYDKAVPVADWKTRHAMDRCLALAEACGAPRPGEPEFLLPEGDPVDESLLAGLPGIVLHPFSRGKGKSLSPSEVIDFCKMLHPLRVVVVGSPVEEPLALPSNAVDLLGKTSLPQLIRLIRDARWTVSVDSGPMHLAAGVTGRLVSIHTWSDPRMVGPCRLDAWVFREGHLLQVREIAPGQFPEQRGRRRHYAEAPRLLDQQDWEKIATLVTQD